MLKFDDFGGKSNLILMCYTANSLVLYIKLLLLDGLDCLTIPFATMPLRCIFQSATKEKHNTKDVVDQLCNTDDHIQNPPVTNIIFMSNQWLQIYLILKGHLPTKQK